MGAILRDARRSLAGEVQRMLMRTGMERNWAEGMAAKFGFASYDDVTEWFRGRE